MQNKSSIGAEFSTGTGFITPEWNLSGAVLDQMEAHALSDSGEVCGLLYSDHYRPLRNIATGTSNAFFADPRNLAQAFFACGEPIAIFHTHPDGNLNLSAVDRSLWYYRNSTMIVGCIFDGRLRWKMYGNRGD
jgi:proteasome lid subunit RPN8/RPN11